MAAKLDRATPAGTAKQLARLVSDRERRTEASQAFAEAVLDAQTYGDSWSVSLRRQRIGLIVGRIPVASIEAGTFNVVLDTRAISQETRHSLERHARLKSDWRFTSVDGTEAWEIPVDHASVLWPSLRLAARTVAERASESGNPYLRAHSPGVIDFLREQTGLELAHRAADVAGDAWLFQANPARFDLRGALATLDELTWDLRQHAGRVAVGDRVYFWESGGEGGLWARGIVIDGPSANLSNPAEAAFLVEPGPADPNVKRARVRIEKHLPEPVQREVARRHPSLADMSFFRAAQGTNFALRSSDAEAFDQLLDGLRPPRIVKIAPGEQGRYWEDCLAGGYICVGWDDVGDLTRFHGEEDFRDAFDAAYLGPGRLYEQRAVATRKGSELWTLRELRPDDLVVANEGIRNVLGVGTVRESAYAFSEERSEYKHLVMVDWDLSMAGPIAAQRAWALRTVADVPADLFRRIREGDFDEEDVEASSPDVPPAERTAFARVRAALQAQGLFYGSEQISAYLAALQTRRFVILSGISGTGKTRLAMAVAEVFEGRTVTSSVLDEDDGHVITVQPYMRKYSRFVVPRAIADDVGSLFVAGEDGRTTIQVKTPRGVYRLSAARDVARDVTWVNLKGPTRDWFRNKFSEGDSFVVTTDEDAGRMTLAAPPPRTQRTRTVSTSLVVPVRPDWTDGRELLGYHNPILDRYVSKPLLELLLEARDEEVVAEREDRAAAPYFVVFDEMNLARVEHYFSDFLSALESDREIPLHDDEAIETGESTVGRAVPRRLVIPRNVFFTGTVNVDESTYMFSPKVLDRAFTLELNRVDLVSFGAGDDAAGFASLTLDELPDQLENTGRPSVEHWQGLGTVLGGELRNIVTDLHDLLVREGHPFGYRVACEIARFVDIAQAQSEGTPEALHAALDLALLMKVLPKLHGTQQELGPVVRQLFAFCVSNDPGQMAEGGDRSVQELAYWKLMGEQLEPADLEVDGKPRLPRCAAKLWRMNRRLEQRGFASFIDG